MYDDCSEFDIVSMMNAINARIQSLARNTAQRWLWGTSKAPEVAGNRHTLTETEMEICRRAFGRQLVRALGSPPPEQSDSAEVLLPLAWQACIVAVVSKILSSFVAGLPTSADGITIDNALRAVSESVKKGEIQPAYGRWRFVTHRYMKTLIPNRNPLQSSVDEALTNCYLAARLALKSSCPDYQAFVDAFRGPVTEIMEEAAKLRTNIQEKMLTANYEPYLPAPAVSFKAESMEVDLKVDRVFLRDTVVCTTRLGLGSSRKKERENSQVLLRENFLKAQVLTERNLREILTGK
ncbi:hypothetical protein FRC01_001726 [Tulasnella sp. 417]|nr:hypothetical protein FRC01_001726 [Tulasnella sp. 417]